MHNSRVGLSPTTYGSAYGNFPYLLFNLLLVIDLFMASSAGSVASSANKRRGGLQLLANITNTSASAKGYALEDQGVNQIEGSPENTSPAESPPVMKSPPPVLRERPKHTQPSSPKKACTHYRHILKGTQICCVSNL